MVVPTEFTMDAVIVTLPVDMPEASPSDPAALEMVAMKLSEVDHVTEVVRFWLEPSEYIPVAVNCLSRPFATVVLDGVICKDCSMAAVTVRVVLPEIPLTLSVAVIVVVPAATEEARPSEPAALEIVAIVPPEFSVHVTVVVRFWLEPSV